MKNLSIPIYLYKLKCLICKQNSFSIKTEVYHANTLNCYINCSCGKSLICYKLKVSLEEIDFEFESMSLTVYNYNGDKYSVIQYNYQCTIEYSPNEPWLTIAGIVFDIHDSSINVLEKVRNCINFS